MNPMISFTTVVTVSQIHHAIALGLSLRGHGAAKLYILVVDGVAECPVSCSSNLVFLGVDDLNSTEELRSIQRRFEKTGDGDQYRLSLKPLLLLHLLSHEGTAVVYCDCDIHFFDNHADIANALALKAVVLVPNWHRHSPSIRNRDFEAMLKTGYFDAGIVGVRAGGEPFLKWWAKACATCCARGNGMYDDQKYLDCVPFLFPNVHVLKHQGYDVAQWNMNRCRRVVMDSRVTVNKIWPIVCIHFNAETIRCIKDGRDPLLQSYLDRYERALVEGSAFVGASLKIRPLHETRSKARRLPIHAKIFRYAGALLMRIGRRIFSLGAVEGVGL